MASNVLAKPNARGLLLLAGAADSLAPRRDYEVINDFRVRNVQKRIILLSVSRFVTLPFQCNLLF